jgi:excisionase family DNA binding protein
MNTNSKRAFTKYLVGPISSDDNWFTTKEASNYLRLNVKSLLNEVSMGNVPYYKLGRRNRYLKSELDQLLLRNFRGILWE